MFISKQTLVIALTGAGSLLACGGSNEEAQAPQQGYPQQPGYQPQPGYQQAPPGQYQTQQPQQPVQQQPVQPQPAQPAPAQPAPAQPGFQLPGMAQPPAGQAQLIDASVAAPAQALIAQLASGETVAGSKPLGSLLAGNFSTGSALETQVQLEPGKCYTVVAAGLPNVTELNVQFVAISPIPGMSPVLAQDQTTGAQAVLGKKPNCYKWAAPFPAPVKLVLTVAGGSGVAGAQVFVK